MKGVTLALDHARETLDTMVDSTHSTQREKESEKP